MDVPKQLKNPNFRFFLLQKNGKIPIEKKYNTINCYPFFHTKVLNHKGNLGILTGIGNLVVIDFDNREFYKSKKTLSSMPKTFCVKTPNKKLYHLYYMLYEEMFKTQGIDIEGKRVVDIMATNGRVVCPPSTISSVPYEVVSDLPIATITYKALKELFSISSEKAKTFKSKETKNNPEAFNKAVEEFARQGVDRYNEHKFRCPFHESDSKSSLYLFSDGGIRCFHCFRYFSNITFFLKDLLQFRREEELKNKEIRFI